MRPSRLRRPGPAVAGVVGPIIFVADWAILGAIRRHYSPVDDAISRLAQIGASTRPAMTAGFIAYGAALVAYGAGDRRSLPVAARGLVAATGLATFGVAALPLDAAGQGTAHAVAAGIGYATLAAAPLVTARSAVHDRGWSRASVAAGTVSAVFLTASAFAPAHGLLQRIGLTVGDAWIVASVVRSRAGSHPGG